MSWRPAQTWCARWWATPTSWRLRRVRTRRPKEAGAMPAVNAFASEKAAPSVAEFVRRQKSIGAILRGVKTDSPGTPFSEAAAIRRTTPGPKSMRYGVPLTTIAVAGPERSGSGLGVPVPSRTMRAFDGESRCARTSRRSDTRQHIATVQRPIRLCCVNMKRLAQSNASVATISPRSTGLEPTETGRWDGRFPQLSPTIDSLADGASCLEVRWHFSGLSAGSAYNCGCESNRERCSLTQPFANSAMRIQIAQALRCLPLASDVRQLLRPPAI